MRDADEGHKSSGSGPIEKLPEGREDKYRIIFENAVVGIYKSLPKGRYIDANPALAHILGYDSPEELLVAVTDIGKQVYKEAGECDRLLRIADETGSCSTEVQVYTKDRKIRWISNDVRAVKEKDNKVLFYEGFIRDITERKTAEDQLRRHRDHLERLAEERTAELRESEKRYRNLIESALVGVYQTNLKGDILYANNNFLRMFGFESLEEMKPAGVLGQYRDPEARGIVIDKLLQFGKFTDFEVELYTKTGGLVNVLLSATLEGDIISGMMLNITERRRALDKLRESEIKYRTLFDNANDAIFLIRNDIIVDWNQRAVTMFGCPKEAIIGQTPYGLSPPFQPDGRSSTGKAREKGRAALSGMPQFFEWKHCRWDGTPFEAEVSLNGVEIGEEALLLAIIRDVSERKESEKRLQVSEEKYRSIFENAVEGIFQTSPEGRYITVNPALAKTFGFNTPEELIDSISDIGKEHYVHPEDRERLKAIYKEQGYVQGFETQLFRRDGSKVWVLINARAVTDKEGKTLYYEGTLENITHRKEMEDALRESEERYRTFIDSTSDMVFLKDDKFRNLVVNRTFRDSLGKKEEEIIGRTDYELMRHEDAKKQRQTDVQALKSRSVLISEEKIRGRTYEARKFPVNLGKNRRGIGGFVRDITERKKAEEELKVKSRSLEEVNAALKVLLKQRDHDKEELEEKILYNVKKLVLPYLDRLKERRLDDEQKTYLEVLETNLKNIISPFVQKMVYVYSNFTASEILVANFIREGKTIKEIARISGVSENAVNRHRQSIRNKLGLNKRKVNLKAYLMSMK
jgi:PAS domain S-box-containing protein